MKYQITRVLFIDGSTVSAHNVDIPTDDIEQTRAELRDAYSCDRINFEYVELG